MNKNERQAIYNAASNMRRSVLTFGKSICRDEKKVTTNFVQDMLFGMMTARDVKLTKIGTALCEDCPLKSTVERLYRNPGNLDPENIRHAYMEKVVRKCREDSVLIVDGGDIAKPYGSKFEGLGLVHDGSSGEIVKGFPMVGMLALTRDKLPLPVYEQIFSRENEDYLSDNAETFKALDYAKKWFSNENIRVFDRGYDSSIVTRELIESGVKFIVRAVGKRKVLHGGESLSILDISKKFKGKYRMDFEKKGGLKAACKIWITPIEMDGERLNLVICNGFGEKPLMLITNVFSDDAKICATIVKCYLMRWKIEEFYRFKKETFGFEDIRVMSLKSMNNLNHLLNCLIGFLSMKSTEKADKPIIVMLVNQVKRIFSSKNILYPLCAGILSVFALTGLAIPHAVSPPPFLQLSLF
jgi:hypothetical protein